jgi:hypothetical protein
MSWLLPIVFVRGRRLVVSQFSALMYIFMSKHIFGLLIDVVFPGSGLDLNQSSLLFCTLLSTYRFERMIAVHHHKEKILVK